MNITIDGQTLTVTCPGGPDRREDANFNQIRVCEEHIYQLEKTIAETRAAVEKTVQFIGGWPLIDKLIGGSAGDAVPDCRVQAEDYEKQIMQYQLTIRDQANQLNHASDRIASLEINNKKYQEMIENLIKEAKTPPEISFFIGPATEFLENFMREEEVGFTESGSGIQLHHVKPSQVFDLGRKWQRLASKEPAPVYYPDHRRDVPETFPNKEGRV